MAFHQCIQLSNCGGKSSSFNLSGLKEDQVASQLADGTLFLSYPKEELESKFLVDPPPASVQRFVCESV